MASGSVVLVFDESTLGDRPARNSDPGDQVGTYGRAFIKALVEKGMNIIPLVVSSKRKYTRVQPFIDAFFLPMLTLTENNFKYDNIEESLYTSDTLVDMYRAYTGNPRDMPPVYFFDRDANHIARMNMFNSYHITQNGSWTEPFRQIIGASGASPARLNLGTGTGSGGGETPTLYSFPPGTQLGVGPPTPTLGGKRKGRPRKTRRQSRKGRTKK